VKKLQAIVMVGIVALAGCAARVPAPVVDRSPQRGPQAAQPPQPGTELVPPGHYAVKRGDTLYSIALEHGVDYRDVAQWNGLDDPTKLSVGQVLRVTPPEPRPGVTIGAARGIGRVEARPLDSVPQPQARAAEGNMKTEPKALRLPYSKENLSMFSGGEPKPQDPDAIEFVWPIKGRVLAFFAEPRSKGIDIEGKLGDAVVAAAAGRVTYIGTGIPGLGKLVVLKHDNGFITVYAHNKDIVVKEQQSVARGQKIAELGASDAERPKLHFQIRKGSSPVDPLRYLPGS
jgi:lipoprotein NlpD